MGSPHIKNVPTKEELYQLKIVENLTRKQIAEKYSVSEETVKKWLSKYDIKSDPKKVNRLIKSIDPTKPITEYSPQTITKVKELEYRLVEETSLLNDMEGLTNSHRYYFLKNGLTHIPKCICGNNVKLNLANADEVFASFCSAECSSKWGKHTQESYNKLNDVEYLKQLRHEQGMSLEDMAKELKSNVDTIKNIMISNGMVFQRQTWSTSPRKEEIIKNRVKSRGINTWGEAKYNQMANPDNLKAMWDNGMTFIEIGNFFGVNAHVISDLFKTHNIPYNPSRWIGNSTSVAEKELLQYITSIYDGKIVQSYRHKYNEYELDIYLPDRNIGFEYNGCFFHSEAYKDKYYHKNKMEYWNDKKIRVISIWEDDWNNTNQRTKNFIGNLLGQNTSRIMARKCQIVELSFNEYYKFLENNHMLGGENSGVRLGLVYNDEIVSVMGFKNKANTKSVWDLTRFSNLAVTGSFSKLLKHFIKTYNPEEIYSLADLEIVDAKNNVYVNQGFSEIYRLPPDYGYFNRRTKNIEHKFGWKKSTFAKLGYDITGKTEHELAKTHGLLRCYDSGKIMYKLTINP